jgi:hypothetical protein
MSETPVNQVGSGANVAGLDQNPPVYPPIRKRRSHKEIRDLVKRPLLNHASYHQTRKRKSVSGKRPSLRGSKRNDRNQTAHKLTSAPSLSP